MHGHRLSAVVVLLAAGTALARVPFLPPRLAHWDAVNYALGLHAFNVAAHQPHPPGSPYYILLGRVVLAFVGDDNRALTAVAVGASALAVVAECALARAVFGVRAGVLAALALATQPIFWGCGSMATPWTLLALLSISIGLVCVRLARGERQWAIPSALLMGAASGFRLDATVFLAPLWLWAVARAERRLARRVLLLALVVAGVLVWLVPVVASSGGLTAWSERLLALFVPAGATREAVLRQFVSNSAISVGTLALSLGPAVLLGLGCDWRTTLRVLRSIPHTDMGRLLLLWVLPALVFLWLVDSTEPGHTLIFTGALCALGAGLLSRTAGRGPRLAACGTLLVLCQAGIFLAAAPRADKPPAWAPNSALLNVTAPGLRQQQDSLEATLQAIRERFSADDTVVVTVTGQNVYRFMMYYLPTYLVLDVDPAAGSVLSARDLRQGTWQEQPECLVDGGWVRHALFVLWTNSEPGLVPEDARAVAGGGGSLLQTWETQPGPETADYLGFRLGGACAGAGESARGIGPGRSGQLHRGVWQV